MNAGKGGWFVSGAVIAGLASSGLAGDEVGLRFTSHSTDGELRLHSRLELPVSAMYPEYTILCSTNLRDWVPVGAPHNGSVGVSDEELRFAVPMGDAAALYRVVATVKMAEAGGGGEAVYGYGTAFGKELRQLGQLPLSEFVSRYGLTNAYLPRIAFDPTTAAFWTEYNTDPVVNNRYHMPWEEAWRSTDFRLNAAEYGLFRTNGFVVSQRMEQPSFADIFYAIYRDNLPVFVTTDAILHAWHRTMVTMLAEVEETTFMPALAAILNAMAGQLPALWGQAAGTAMANGVLDADYFLAVARSLASGVDTMGSLGQATRITGTLNAIGAQQPVLINLFGEDRFVDFSQFRVRGHYETRAVLGRYFRAMMWCGLADLRYAGSSLGVGSGSSDNTLRELAGAVALELALRHSGALPQWVDFNRKLELFVGTSDALDFAQLHALLVLAGIDSAAALPDEAALAGLQNRLISGQLGLQQILGAYYWSPLSAVQVKLPRSFCVMGGRFVVDSWAFDRCTFDKVLWDEDGIPTMADKVRRRVPSALDVAFAVLGNSQIVPELAARMARTGLTPDDGRSFWRDGHPYQHNLAAVRNVIDQQEPAGWTNSIYSHWLACLRELSAPTTGSEYPQAMRTRAWAMKTLNTQLASWTELRHNSTLYAKQSYTPPYLCSYPVAYVEPCPAFYGRVHDMALATRAVVTNLSSAGWFRYLQYSNNVPIYVTLSGFTLYTNRVAVLDRFLEATTTLRAIAEKELAQAPLSAGEIDFLERTVEMDYAHGRTYTGWYPGLFYKPGYEYVPPNPNAPAQATGNDVGSDYWDALVTDVHTDGPDPLVRDPGSVLHEAVGNVQLLMIAVDCGSNGATVYAGPVLSHYEFELGPTQRLTDTEWKARITARDLPPQPDWTRCYLVPSP
jgi:hypothetical protein